MKFSIVTISFNQKHFLKEAMDSVLVQDVELEYIVVDPGSTDGSRSLIDSYGEKVAKRIYRKDDGPAHGLSMGFDEASGDIFGFLNSDDALAPGALSKVEKFFRDNPDVDIVAGCGYFIDAESNPYRKIAPSRFNKWLYLMGVPSLFQQGTFFRASAYKKAGGFNLENRTCWDSELYIDMVNVGAKYKCVSDKFGFFRIHGDSITGSGRLTDKYILEQDRIFEKITGRKPSFLDRILSRYCARLIKYITDPMYIFRRM